MAYDRESWTKRHRGRVDISVALTHFTRPVKDGAGKITTPALDIILKILSEKKINGSNNAGFVCGKTTAVCFQDAPLLGLAQNVMLERELGSTDNRHPKYVGVGLAFSKSFAYSKGARPVFYEQSASAKEMLNAAEHWRIVSLDLSNDSAYVDWTHEREWRCPGDFTFEWNNCVVILENPSEYRHFVRRAPPEMQSAIMGVTMLHHSLF